MIFYNCVFKWINCAIVKFLWQDSKRQKVSDDDDNDEGEKESVDKETERWNRSYIYHVHNSSLTVECIFRDHVRRMESEINLKYSTLECSSKVPMDIFLQLSLINFCKPMLETKILRSINLNPKHNVSFNHTSP